MEDRGTKRTSAQSATELALFGAILVFVIGAIVRTGLSSSMMLNVNLRVLRMALRESYLTSEGAYKREVFNDGRKWDQEGSNARNMASVFVLEDRLSVTPGSKIGTSDRIPFVSMASATMSRNLFRHMDFGEVNDIGLTDVIINGLRFPFATGGFKEVVLSNDDGSKPDWIPLCSEAHSQEKDNPPPYGLCWLPEGLNVFQCVDMADGNFVMDYDGTCVPAPGGPGTGDKTQVAVGTGFTVMYSLVGNYANSSHGCFGDEVENDCSNMPQDMRFDLDFSGTLEGDEPSTIADRNKFMWQWYMVAGVQDEFSENLNFPWAFPSGVVGGGVRGIDTITGQEVNVSVDVDGDFFEESVMSLDYDEETGVIRKAKVYDYQDGDVSSSDDARIPGLWTAVEYVSDDPGCGDTPVGTCERTDPDRQGGRFGTQCYKYSCEQRPVGVASDIQTYTFTGQDPNQDGAYLRLEEGRLINPASGQFVRSTTRKDTVDIVERVYYITRDTGRFCLPDHRVRDWDQTYTVGDVIFPPLDGVAGLVNPVEACTAPKTNPPVTCFDSGNLELTCMDQDNLLIFIRSRIQDLRGRRWLRRYAP